MIVDNSNNNNNKISDNSDDRLQEQQHHHQYQQQLKPIKELGFVLLGEQEYHDLIIDDDHADNTMEQILLLRESSNQQDNNNKNNNEDGEIHVLSINRKVIEVLIRECGITTTTKTPRGGGQKIKNNYNHQIKKNKLKKKGNCTGNKNNKRGGGGPSLQNSSSNTIRSIQTKTRAVCPDCSSELEVSLNIEVENILNDNNNKQEQSHGHNMSSSAAENNHNTNINNAATATVVQYLRKENHKQQKRMNSLLQQNKQLRIENQKLQETHMSSQKEALEVLEEYTTKKNMEFAQLKTKHQQALEEYLKEATHIATSAETEWKIRLKQQQEETARIWGMLEKLRTKYRALSRQLREICPTPSFQL